MNRSLSKIRNNSAIKDAYIDRFIYVDKKLTDSHHQPLATLIMSLHASPIK